jgi:UDP-N-acetylmuramyl-tripeptide synthetase
LPVETIVSGIASVRRVRGRFEPIRSTADWTAIVDYAHTPDAIEKCLTAIHDILPGRGRGRVITVFGAGGDRDREKRPKMMRAAAEASDLVIVTSDNPRSEDPAAIIEEIAAGAPHGLEHRRITDRREAIYYALSIARGGDVVLVAGKGHEQVQIVGDRRFQFDDRTVIEEYIREHAA